MKTLLCLVALAVAAFAVPADTDVSGKWSGTFNVTGPDGAVEESTAVAVLKQNGTELTGTAGPNEDEQYQIANGKIEGDKITMEVRPREGQVIRLALVLAGDRIKGDAVMERDGEKRTAKLDMGRVAPSGASAHTDVSGKWTGTSKSNAPDGSTNEGTAVIVLKQNGAEITGTAGPNEDEQYQIAKGRIEGGNIALEVQPNEGQPVKVSLVLSGERLKGEAVMERDGEKRTIQLDLGRVK